jgi:hydrogenase-4 component B
MFDSITFVWVITALFFIGCLIAGLGRSWKRATDLSLGFALIGSAYAAFVTGAIWMGFWSPFKTEVLWKSSWLTINDFLHLPALQWEIRIDNLSAFFGFIITVFSGLVAIYSFESLKVPHYRKQSRRIAAALNIFVWSMLMVVIVNDAFSLLVTLEILSLTIAYLALDEEEAQHATTEKLRNAQIAPQVYLITSHTSTAFLLIAFLLLVIPAGSLSFDQLRVTGGVMEPVRSTAVFLLALAGLGIRAGLVPGHFWTPLVHPSSPANIHALLSGIAIKVSVYLMYRFFFQFLSPQPWWGYTVLTVAVITAIVNVWYAIASHDLKEALGYHSNENIGIILVGMGVAMIYVSGSSATAQWIAALALIASLYHLLNHAVFKSLLYWLQELSTH